MLCLCTCSSLNHVKQECAIAIAALLEGGLVDADRDAASLPATAAALCGMLFSDSPSVVHAALVATAQLCASSPSGCDEVVVAGAPRALVALLGEADDYLPLESKLHAVYVVSRIAWRSPALQSALVAAGAVPPLVTLLQTAYRGGGSAPAASAAEPHPALTPLQVGVLTTVLCALGYLCQHNAKVALTVKDKGGVGLMSSILVDASDAQQAVDADAMAALRTQAEFTLATVLGRR